ncbi:MAG TPA: copper resistance system multicopper oxidase [Steroidobacteraceae bacterium]
MFDKSRRRFVHGPATSAPISRRRFVQGVATTAAAAAGVRLAGAGALAALGAPSTLRAAPADDGGRVLHGPEIDLSIAELPINLTGVRRVATAVNGGVPGPLLRWREGDDVVVRVTNRLSAPTSIHWHGVIVPADMDGVPGVSFKGIAPGETFAYRFRAKQSGTYWYHSHSRFQEQIGLYGPLLITPRNGERHAADREHVILLSDWTDIDPEHLYRTLKVRSGYFNFGRRTVSDFVSDARARGLSNTLSERRMWGEMRMDPTDLADVSAYAYTFLMNGVTPSGNWTGLFERGERVRLRIINGSSMTYFDVRIPGLKMSVVAADGQDVEPVSVDEFRIGAAEVYDVIVEPKEERAYAIFAQSVDRSGYAVGTLAPKSGMKAEVPSLDARPLLTMTDMAMGMEGAAPAALHSPIVDSIAAQPESRLDDPGVGLRDDDRRALTYADLHTIGGPLDSREPGREIVLHLTGHMARFVWSFDGQKFSEAEPLRFRHGERLTLVLVNDSMMLHPIHLHGMWGEIYTPEGQFLARKHTITVQPGQRLAYRVTADALGTWAFHCHLLYHMEAGMFREVIVEDAS